MPQLAAGGTMASEQTTPAAATGMTGSDWATATATAASRPQVRRSSYSEPQLPARFRLPPALNLGLQQHNRNLSLFTPPDTPFVNMMGNASAALDAFVLTFNCGKAVVDVPTFAKHLRGALMQRGQPWPRVPEPLVELGSYDVQADGVKLPDLVVFSLQEIAPLTYAYLGGQFLLPYFNSFRDALNSAASDLLQEQDRLGQRSSASGSSKHSTTENSGRSTPRRQPVTRSKSTISNIFRRQNSEFPYKLVEARNVGMTAIMLFARKPETIARVQTAECAFGIADMGNKGAIALRVTYIEDPTEDGEDSVDGVEHSGNKGIEVTFVATHLAAMEYNLRRRNANWASICSSCLFEDPQETLPEEYHSTAPGAKNIVEASTHSSSKKTDAKQTDGGEDIPPETQDERDAFDRRREREILTMPSEYSDHLRDISIFKPDSILFVAGDLNYRISTTTPPALAQFPTMDNYLEFLERDQLTQEKNARRTLHGLTEPPITFPPTYKIKHLSRDKAKEAVNRDQLADALLQGRDSTVVPWKWATHRWPGWCDRILYLDVPNWVKRHHMGVPEDSDDNNAGGTSYKEVPEVKIHAYNSLPTMLTSDHQPVYLRATVPLFKPGELHPDAYHQCIDDAPDPRFNAPVPIDTGAFARRAAARKKEVMTGMTALFLSTKEGAIVMAAIIGMGLWSWWLYKGLF